VLHIGVFIPKVASEFCQFVTSFAT